jgi:hypothetical protein
MAARSTTGRAVAVGLSALATVIVFLHFWKPSVVAGLTVEDGAVEYLTAALFLVAAVAFSAAAVVRAARKLWVLPLAAACFLVAGEEVSWGQRLRGVGTPGALAEVNVQGETNLHNIEGVHGIVRAVSVVVLVTLFALLPLAAQRFRAVRELADGLRFPLPPLLAAILVLAGVAFMAAPRILSGEVSFAFDEVGEFYVAAAWLVFALSTWAVPGTVPVPGQLADLGAAGRERALDDAMPAPAASATTAA